MDDMLQRYLKDKYGENYEKQAQADYEESKSRINTGNALSNLAEAFGQAAGRSRVGDSDAYFQGLNKQAKEDTIGKIAADKAQFVKDQSDAFNMQDIADKSKIRDQENDLNNPMLKNYKEQMAKFGVVVPEGMTLAQAKRDLGEAKTLNELKMKSTIDNQNKIQLMLMEQKFKEKENDLNRNLEREKTTAKNSSEKAKFDNLPQDKQEVITGLAKKNASKISIANQIDSVMGNWDSLSKDQKLAQGRQLLKTLNSTEGADAIGTDEANRLGSKLEFAMGNLTNSNSIQFGRDLSGFKDQATITSQSIKDAIKSNQRVIDQNYGRSFSEPSKTVKVTNGKETLEIPIEDLADAKKDGFNEVGSMAGR